MSAPLPYVDLPPALSFYRDRTTALLRRYERLSVEVGRLPSLFGREYFRARVTSYRPASFEDVVVFVHDIERSLGRLDPRFRLMLDRMAIQDYSELEVARELHMTERRIRDLYHDALDCLSQDFLDRGILHPRDARAPRTRSHITLRASRAVEEAGADTAPESISRCGEPEDRNAAVPAKLEMAPELVNPTKFIVSSQASQP